MPWKRCYNITAARRLWVMPLQFLSLMLPGRFSGYPINSRVSFNPPTEISGALTGDVRNFRSWNVASFPHVGASIHLHSLRLQIRWKKAFVCFLRKLFTDPIPWESSPCKTTIWENMYLIFSNHQDWGEYSCWDDIWEIPKVFRKYIGRTSPTTQVSSLFKKGMIFFKGYRTDTLGLIRWSGGVWGDS